MASRKLIVEIVGDSKSLEKSLSNATSATRKFSVGFGTIFKSAVGFAAVTAGINGLSKAVHAGIEEFSQQQQVAAQTAAALKSTGSAANVTAKQIETLGTRLSNLSGIDDEIIKSGENVLLSFTQIRNAAGKGNDIFNQAAKAAVNFAVRTGRDVPQAALILGKALADPASKLSSLARAGVVFTKEQLKGVAAIQKTQGVLAAQKVVLAELEQRFGGAAKAAGETLTGKLNILRERARDLGGDLIGLLAPAFTKVVTAATEFAKKLSAAQTIRAKFKVVADGVSTLGRDLFRQLESAFRKVDFAQTVKVVQERLIAGFQRIGDFLQRVDFKQVGRSLGDAIAAGANGAADFLASVDWGKVGQKVVDGIGAFLRGVNWKAVFTGIYRVIVFAANAVASIIVGAGEEVGKAFLRGIISGIDKLRQAAVKKALEVALSIVKALDFTVLGHSIIPGLDSLKKSIEKRLDEISAAAKKTARDVASASDAIAKPAGSVNRSAAVTSPSAAARTVQSTADAAIAAAAAATKGSAATTSAADKAAAAAQKARDAFNNLLDALQLGVEKAGVTAKLNDDLVALRKVEAALKARLKIEKNSVDLQRQLFQTQQQIADVQKQQRDATQFKSLGLDATGQPLVATKVQLAAELKKITAGLSGSIADTASNRKVLDAIRKLVLNPFTKVSSEVRSTIKQMLDDINGQLANAGNRQGRSALNTKQFIKSLNLNLAPADVKKLRFAIAGLGAAAPATGSIGAFGVAVPAASTTVNTTVTLDGQKVAQNTTKHQQRRNLRNPTQKRGPFGGRI